MTSLPTYRVWSVNTKTATPLWIMGTYTLLRNATNRAKEIVTEAGGSAPRRFNSVIQVETDVEYSCVFIIDDNEIIGAIVEALTLTEGDDLIYPLTAVLCNDVEQTIDELED